jgi:Nucleoside-diphosphate-sugar pyrophosphorylase involved in lipopolysaccharide biosynthesis/translation initiation factor 2B, gamma/epsilon subunits (eIF-2Bgamma/eIF-2Bepsilon)
MKHVEFSAVILASTCGARLYPLTSSSTSTSSSTADSMTMGKDALTSSLNTAIANNTLDHHHDNDRNNHPHGENADGATQIHQQEQQQQGIAATGETYMPKHLLPLAGRPILFHLVEHCEKIGMTQIIIAIGSEDHQLGMTQRSLLSMMRGCTTHPPDAHSVLQAGGDSIDAATDLSPPTSSSSDGWQYGNARIVIVPLPADCGGSADALRHVVSSNVIRSTLSGKNHVMVLPADLVLYGHLGRESEDAIMKKARDSSSSGSMGVCHHTADTTPESAAGSILFWNALGSLANVHRREYRAGLKKGMPLAMTLLLADVGEEDESGIPLKESAKVSGCFFFHLHCLFC